MDISSGTLKEALEFMKNEQYILLENVQDLTDLPKNYDYTLIDVYDIETNPDAKNYAEYGYSIQKFKTLDDAMDVIGCIACGGLYTAVGLYYKNINITKKIRNMIHYVPLGKTPIFIMFH